MAQDLNRRAFLTAGAASTLLATGNFAHAAGDDKIRVGLVGCGGRGTGAAGNCASADPAVQIVAIGDLFKDRVDGCKNYLRGAIKEQYQVSDDHCFVGFDAYKQVLAQKIDIVILATPPGFRPLHFKAAVEAGKNVFMEKPVAVDGAGVRTVMASGAVAQQKGLAVVSGTQRRHQAPYLEIMKRIHDGAIGEVVAGQVYWNQGGLWLNDRRDGWSDTEYQIRNWLYYAWLSGDHIVEQHIHNLDVANWALNAHPVKCLALGGRQVRTAPQYGHVYDHFAVEYEYPNGARIQSFCRQIDGTDARVSERIVGTKGTSDPNANIKDEKGKNIYRWQGNYTDPYVQEHINLIASIRAGKPLNEANRVAESTLTAIMGRMSAYTGREVSWDKALNSQEVLMPAEVAFGPRPVAPVAVPGQTPLR
jgi:predicted dehydrogenase